ncbi:hypothetical protein H9636_16465 [Ureibacillus sp. Re31]|uniref:Uncharacterized protein n=1 Tax=Ureibacillus galli TaxID=2762222 RepID=A0ABR8XG79_9BACL|nr:hypothetical protein [Ureibacillus galli]MBD8028243.1 hypothetical protein [Ureibacillus galli]
MENNALMYTILFLGHLISASLALAIITSIIVNSRKKGILFLTIYLLLNLYSLTIVFKISTLMGISMLMIYIGLGVLTYFVIKRKLSKGTAI